MGASTCLVGASAHFVECWLIECTKTHICEEQLDYNHYKELILLTFILNV